MDGHGRSHGTKTHAKTRKRHMGGTMVRGRVRIRRRTKIHTHRHGRSHGETSTTTQGANAWMNMDGTMGRRRSTKTWAGPWYEYEDEDTHKRMEELTNAQQRTLASLLASGA